MSNNLTLSDVFGKDATFSFFGGASAPNATNSNNKATANQVKFYLDLCIQKNRTPEDGYENFSYEIMRDKIDVLMKYYPPSERQLKLISEKVANLQKAGVDITVDYSTLTGGMGGTASTLIGQLIELEKTHVKQSMSINQLNFIVQMYACPDVDFESYGILRKIQLEDDTFRRPSANEFAEMIMNKMSKQQASEFIDIYRNAFNKWKQTRIRPNQLSYLKKLFEHTGTQYEEVQLAMLSTEEASKWIEQLLDERKRKDTSEEEEQQPLYQINRNPHSTEEAIANEEDKVEKIVYSLISKTNFEPDNLQEILSKEKALKEYLLYLVEDNLLEPETLVEIINDNELLKQIFA